MSRDLDPAAIMAAHEPHTNVGNFTHCVGQRHDDQPHCLPYRLAAEVVTLRAQVEAVQAESEDRLDALIKARAERNAFRGAAADLAQANRAEVDALRKVVAALEGRQP